MYNTLSMTLSTVRSPLAGISLRPSCRHPISQVLCKEISVKWSILLAPSELIRQLIIFYTLISTFMILILSTIYILTWKPLGYHDTIWAESLNTFLGQVKYVQSVRSSPKWQCIRMKLRQRRLCGRLLTRYFKWFCSKLRVKHYR